MERVLLWLSGCMWNKQHCVAHCTALHCTTGARGQGPESRAPATLLGCRCVLDLVLLPWWRTEEGVFGGQRLWGKWSPTVVCAPVAWAWEDLHFSPRMDGWISVWVDGRVDGCLYGWLYACVIMVAPWNGV